MAADQKSRRDAGDLSALISSDPDVAAAFPDMFAAATRDTLADDAGFGRQPAPWTAPSEQVATFRDSGFLPEVMPSLASAPGLEPKSR